ncbi:hypothetical protein HDV57DRAFT_368305 [Trichoderma longibrachiatum]
MLRAANQRLVGARILHLSYYFLGCLARITVTTHHQFAFPLSSCGLKPQSWHHRIPFGILRCLVRSHMTPRKGVQQCHDVSSTLCIIKAAHVSYFGLEFCCRIPVHTW